MAKFLDGHGGSKLLLQNILTSEQLAIDTILLWDTNEDSCQRRLLLGDANDNK